MKNPRRLLLAGCACLNVVVLAHVAERFQILPGMGWGLPNSSGHYLDLVSAISGGVLFLMAAIRTPMRELNAPSEIRAEPAKQTWRPQA